MPPFDTVDWEADRDWEWHTAKDDTPQELRALFDEAVRRADAIIDEASPAAGSTPSRCARARGRGSRSACAGSSCT